MTQTPLAAETRPPAREPLYIGDWRVEAELNQIVRGGQVVKLEPKAVALLLHLAERPGEVARREELLAAVWPGVVVGDNALTQVVAKLRKALGDTAQEPAYLQAIAKRGYRLIAPVRRGELPSAGIGAGAPPHSAAAGISAPKLFAAGALVVAVAAIWLWRADIRPADAPPSAAPPVEPSPAEAIPVIAVQPFEVLAPDAGKLVLARALSADLVTDLSKIASIRIAYGSTDASPDTLQPRYRLSGTVQQEGDRLRLNVLLIDATDGHQVWSDRLDRQLGDLFAVQDDLVRSILQKLPVKVSEAETLRLAQRHTRNLQAWDRFVRAQAALLVRRREQNDAARALYWEAIRLDPAFARAYAGLALTYAVEYQQGWAKDAAATLGRAHELAETSVRMDTAMPEALWVRAFVLTQRREHGGALRDLDEALRLNPSYADAKALKGGIETYLGRPAAAVPQLREALRLNPQGGALYFLLLGRAYYFLGDFEQARVNLSYALGRNAESLEAHLYLAAADWQAGDVGGARWQAEEIRALEPGFRVDTWLATYPLTDDAKRERLRATLSAIGLP